MVRVSLLVMGIVGLLAGCASPTNDSSSSESDSTQSSGIDNPPEKQTCDGEVRKFPQVSVTDHSDQLRSGTTDGVFVLAHRGGDDLDFADYDVTTPGHAAQITIPRGVLKAGGTATFSEANVDLTAGDYDVSFSPKGPCVQGSFGVTIAVQ